jgi:hypothetical protein
MQTAHMHAVSGRPGSVRPKSGQYTVDYCSVQLDMSVLKQSLAESKALYSCGRSCVDPQQSAVAFLLDESVPPHSASKIKGVGDQ